MDVKSSEVSSTEYAGGHSPACLKAICQRCAYASLNEFDNTHPQSTPTPNSTGIFKGDAMINLSSNDLVHTWQLKTSVALLTDDCKPAPCAVQRMLQILNTLRAKMHCVIA
jgi:hypothetical protein